MHKWTIHGCSESHILLCGRPDTSWECCSHCPHVTGSTMQTHMHPGALQDFQTPNNLAETLASIRCERPENIRQEKPPIPPGQNSKAVKRDTSREKKIYLSI